MIYTVGGIKGGGGKTTIATNLAIWLGRKGCDVLLVDADEQETATDFTAWREQTLDGQVGYTAVKLTGEAVRSQVAKLREKYDHVVIDTGGRDTTSQRAALVVSDVYLVPFNPRSFDIWTLHKVRNLLGEIRAVRPEGLKAYCFLNRADPRGTDNDEAAALLADAEGIAYLPHPVINRKAFSHSAGRGLSVMELVPPDEKATAEINLLFQTIHPDQNR